MPKGKGGVCVDSIGYQLLKMNAVDYPIQYKWDDDEEGRFQDLTTGLIAVESPLDKVSYKAAIGMAAALLELIFYRLNGRPEMTENMIQDIKWKIDALWMAAIDPRYIRETTFYDNKTDVSEPSEGAVYGPLWVALLAVEELAYKLDEKYYHIYVQVIGMALLAEYISPDRKLFQQWLVNTLQKAMNSFPCGFAYRDFDEDDAYDYDDEPPVFRDLFFLPGVYDEDFAVKNAKAFVKSVRKKKNPYLRTPQKMLQLEFDGVPYTL
jgi:hypothetical protein